MMNTEQVLQLNGLPKVDIKSVKRLKKMTKERLIDECKYIANVLSSTIGALEHVQKKAEFYSEEAGMAKIDLKNKTEELERKLKEEKDENKAIWNLNEKHKGSIRALAVAIGHMA